MSVAGQDFVVSSWGFVRFGVIAELALLEDYEPILIGETMSENRRIGLVFGSFDTFDLELQEMHSREFVNGIDEPGRGDSSVLRPGFDRNFPGPFISPAGRSRPDTESDVCGLRR